MGKNIARFCRRRFRPLSLKEQLFEDYNRTVQVAIWKCHGIFRQSALGHQQTSRQVHVMSASLIGRLGSSTLRLPTATVSMSLTGSCFSSESAPGALPLWDSKTRWNNLLGGLAVRRTAGPSGHTNSPHPSSRKGHHSTERWSSSVLLSHVVLISSHATAAGSIGTRCRQPRCGA